jgi:hypothetical protein
MSPSKLLNVEPGAIVDYILPVLLPKLPSAKVQTNNAPAASGGEGGATSFEDLSGTIDDAQAPQFLKLDGTRPLAGHLAVGAGFTIDGVDISAHVSDPEAHHDLVSVSGPLTISGQLVGLNYGQGLQNVLGVQLAVRLDGDGGLQFGSLDGLKLGTPGTVGVGTANTVSGSTHTHGVDYTTSGVANKLLALDSASKAYAVTFEASTRVRTPLVDTASGALTLRPAGDLHLYPVGTFIKVRTDVNLQSEVFLSGFTGSGWRIDYNVSRANAATAEFDDLTVRGLLRVYELVISKIRTGNGSYLFSDGGKVAAVSGTGPYTLTFDEDHGLAANDLLKAQRFSGAAYISNVTVTSAPSKKTAIVTLHSGSAPAAGFEYVRIGNTTDTNRQGSVYITSNDSGAPYIDIINGVASHADWGAPTKNKGRFGKLTGITGVANEYGLMVGTGYTSADQYLRLSTSAANNGINNLPLTLTSGGSPSIKLDPSGGISIYSASVSTVPNRLNFYNAPDGTLTGYMAVQHTAYGARMLQLTATKGYLQLISQDVGGIGGSAYSKITMTGGAQIQTECWGFFITASSYNPSFPATKTFTFMYDRAQIDGNEIWHGGNLANPMYDGGNFTAVTIAQVRTAQIRTSGTLLTFTNYAASAYTNIWANNVGVLGGDLLSNNVMRVRNLDNTGYQHLQAQTYNNQGGYYYSPNYHQFVNNSGAAYQRVYMGELSVNAPGAWSGNIGVPSNGSNYGYFDYYYAGARSGYLLWSASEFRVVADGGRYLTMHAARLGIKTFAPAYDIDIAGEGHISGTMRTDVAFSLLPQASAPGVSAAYGVLYVNSAGQLRFLRRGGGDYYVAG